MSQAVPACLCRSVSQRLVRVLLSATQERQVVVHADVDLAGGRRRVLGHNIIGLTLSNLLDALTFY